MINMEVIYALIAILSLITLDTILGVAIAIKDGIFVLSKLPDTLKNNVLPYVLPLIGIALPVIFSGASAMQAVEGFFFAFSAAYSAKLLIDVGSKVKELYGITV